MRSRRHLDILSIDRATFERLLQEGLQNPTPTVLLRPAAGHKSESSNRMLYRSDTSLDDVPKRQESCIYTTKLQPVADETTFPHVLLTHSNSSALDSQISEKHAEGKCVEASESKRGYVLHELIDTEQVYVKDLEILVAVFAVSLCKHAGSCSIQAEQMLRPLQVLFSFQYRFLKSLREHNSVVATARLFSAEASSFAVYIDYCGSYHWLCDFLEQLKTDAAWSKFTSDFQQRMAAYSDTRRLGLRDFLIKPVQRICKYPLFLKELIKYTNECTESDTFYELHEALAHLKGVCEGVDQVQQRIDSQRLRHALLSSYSDNLELPLHVVSKLGEIVLSGPLHIAGCNDKGMQAPRPLGCTLFKRFLLILKPKRADILVPQFWFPLHTMQAVDDGLMHSWRLQHVKSGQFMVFQALSIHEKHMWMDALRKAIATATEYVQRRQAKQAGVDQPHKSPLLQSALSNGSTNQSSSSSKPAAEPSALTEAAIAAAAAAVAASPPSTPSRSTSVRHFWNNGNSSNRFTISRPKSTEKQFKKFTSPEILRLRTAEALKHEKTAHEPASPHFRFQIVANQAIALPDNNTSTDNRPSNGSYPSHTTAVDADHHAELDADSDEYGAFSIGSTCHEPARQQTVKHRPDHLYSINSSKHHDYQRSFEDERLDATSGDYSSRFFEALNFSTLKRKATTSHIRPYSEEPSRAAFRHGRSFSANTGSKKY
ncbi:hypothetical protein IWW36_002204 [Coemansia brasiliensis]|uniref:DH domain-containing protein n=1 Tax=Coemansia brasiliensis TaxID=2650707 RepID=A0A9W8M036_9FUNG|nr:hypothetical protein IWW36_002204 [Coemansia brasiliensis]